MTFWVAGAAVVGAIGGAVISSDSSRSASNKQKDANAAALATNQTAIGEQQREFDLTRADQQQTRDDYAPYRVAGTSALGSLQTDINTPVTAADVESDPGYAFGQQQGQLGLDRKAAASGGRVSGAALKAASEFATNYASNGYNAAYQRKQDRLNRLAAIAGIGQTATGSSSLAGAGAGNVNQITSILGQSANLQSSLGNAQGAATIAQGNIWGSAINQLGAAGARWAATPTATPAPAVNYGSDPTGYLGTQNNPSAYVAPG